MKRRQFLSDSLGFALIPLGVSGSWAQSGPRMPVIGLLDAGDRKEGWDALRQRLRELGYVEGRNVVFEQRIAKGNLDGLPALAQELLQRKVVVIVTSSSAAAVAAERATRTIPIVMATGGDQVSRGLASSLSRPGGNVTGLSSVSSDLMGKRLELLLEATPKAARLAALWQADYPSSASLKELEVAATRARVGFQSVRFRNGAELTDAFAAMNRERIGGVIVINQPLVYAERKRIAELALKHKVPAIYGSVEYAEAGGLLSYGPSYPELFRRAATYVDKILKGANPADLPIEQPTIFELVINASTARALGLTIPPPLLARANRIVE